jgi:hypothetical protein
VTPPTADALGDTGTLVAALGALLVVATAARNWWRRTFGRRADRRARLARLGTGARLGFFESVLGEPPAMRQTVIKTDAVEWIGSDDPEYDPSGEIQWRQVTMIFEVSTFVDREYFVQTVTDTDETVLAFSVTTRSPRFKPVFEIPSPPSLVQRLRWKHKTGERFRPVVKLKLGKTTFADLFPEPNYFTGWLFRIGIGAHSHFYSEKTYLGNPGYYQTFVWTASDAARHGAFAFKRSVHQEIDGDQWPGADESGPNWEEMPETRRFRSATVITTYTVIHPSLMIENYPRERFGPHEDEIRLLP